MDVDLAALRAIERDKDISEEYLIKTLEDALLNAYNKTPHAANFHGGATDAAGCAGAEGGVDSGGRGAVTAILRVLMCHVTAAWACCDNPQP